MKRSRRSTTRAAAPTRHPVQATISLAGSVRRNRGAQADNHWRLTQASDVPQARQILSSCALFSLFRRNSTYPYLKLRLSSPVASILNSPTV